MRDWIATDSNDNIVGKWRRHGKPKVPDGIDITEVDDVSNYQLDYWHDTEDQ